MQISALQPNLARGPCARRNACVDSRKLHARRRLLVQALPIAPGASLRRSRVLHCTCSHSSSAGPHSSTFLIAACCRSCKLPRQQAVLITLASSPCLLRRTAIPRPPPLPPPKPIDGPSTSGAASCEESWALLKAFTLAEARGGPGAAQRYLSGAAERGRLREALMVRMRMRACMHPAAAAMRGWGCPFGRPLVKSLWGQSSSPMALSGVARLELTRSGVRTTRVWAERVASLKSSRVAYSHPPPETPLPWTCDCMILQPPVHATTTQCVYTQPWPDAGWAPQSADQEVLMGLMAGDARVAVRALRDWCGALGLTFVLPECKVGWAGWRAGGRAGRLVAGDGRGRPERTHSPLSVRRGRSCWPRAWGQIQAPAKMRPSGSSRRHG
jgi:hypothetical protein